MRMRRNPFPGTLFVLTHRTADQPAAETGFRLVAGLVAGLDAAFAQAAEAAGDGDVGVGVGGGADVIRHLGGVFLRPLLARRGQQYPLAGVPRRRGRREDQLSIANESLPDLPAGRLRLGFLSGFRRAEHESSTASGGSTARPSGPSSGSGEDGDAPVGGQATTGRADVGA
jgi:hypothetical protein